MDVIAVLNQKGGSGKTTISMNLARALQLDGHDVVLVDSDPQGSARDWAAAAEESPVPTIGIDRPTHSRDVPKIQARYVIIDGAPQTAELAVSALSSADLVLIPVQPSPLDVWATADLVSLVKQRIMITGGKLKAAFVISRAGTGTNLSAEIRETLAEYELPVLVTTIGQRVAYPTTAKDGSTVVDTKLDLAASNEVRELAAEVRSILDGTHEGAL
ncbi:ParA family partition ATPase [Rathayibacter sp. VKM Ac-2929]|uniref:ParA family partition ATPase n=1 Tax=Rathayibacter sp. VKM Ac-2929 TaxID=2929480 RepID=UPI0024367834|nr:ParA family partition ATPase [Rathayibacter sp. VKM Ac-2929]